MCYVLRWVPAWLLALYVVGSLPNTLGIRMFKILALLCIKLIWGQRVLLGVHICRHWIRRPVYLIREIEFIPGVLRIHVAEMW